MSDRIAASSAEASARMKATGQRDTKAEIVVRRELHRRGLRYRVDHPLPGLRRRRADMLFGGAKVVVFIDGCFWHGCPIHATAPRANNDLWRQKLDRNIARDRDTDRHLAEQGWTSLRFWEHENPIDVADRIEAVVRRLPRSSDNASHA